MRVPLPPFAPGLRVGIFGGSFNPPHDGHRLVAETALRRLGLDRIWWLVTPGNPLKEAAGLPTQEARMALCRALCGRDPRMVVSGMEREIGTRYSQETIAFLLRRCRGVRFVWLMGADNLAGFHRWKNWEIMAKSVPMAVIDRPGSTLKAVSAKAAKRFSGSRVCERSAKTLPRRKPAAWLFLHGPRSPLSSTQIRKARGTAS